MENLDNVVAYIDYHWMFFSLAIEDTRSISTPNMKLVAKFDPAMLRHDELCLEMVGCLDSGLH